MQIELRAGVRDFSQQENIQRMTNNQKEEKRVTKHSRKRDNTYNVYQTVWLRDTKKTCRIQSQNF